MSLGMHDLHSHRLEHRILIEALTEVRRTVGGHPDAPFAGVAVHHLRGLGAALEAHFQRERRDVVEPLRAVDPAAADAALAEQANLLARLHRLPDQPTALLEAHGLALDIRRHLRREETELWPRLGQTRMVAA
jgi:hypothetical protein